MSQSFHNGFVPHVLVLVLAIFGIANGTAATKIITVNLKTHVQICRQKNASNWEVIDETGPADLTFEASLSEISTGFRISTAFVWRTRSKKGKPYSARFLAPVELRYDHGNGVLKADMRQEVVYDRKRANVLSTPTTELLSSPSGGLKGERVRGKLGTTPASVTLVSVCEFRPIDNSPPLILVCRDEYKFMPKN